MITKQPLLLSASKEMNVNGGTPKTFSYSPAARSILRKMKIILIDDGTSTSIKFGSITGLTNGVLIQTVIGATTTTLATFKDNGDLTSHCDQVSFGSSAVLSILGIVTPQGFLNSTDVMEGSIEFPKASEVDAIILEAGDTIQAVVQDDLTNIDLFRITVELGTQ